MFKYIRANLVLLKSTEWKSEAKVKEQQLYLFSVFLKFKCSCSPAQHNIINEVIVAHQIDQGWIRRTVILLQIKPLAATLPTDIIGKIN